MILVAKRPNSGALHTGPGLPGLRFRKGEPEVKGVEVGQHFLKFGFVAVDSHFAAFRQIAQFQLAQGDVIEGGSVKSDRAVGLIRLCTLETTSD